MAGFRSQAHLSHLLHVPAWARQPPGVCTHCPPVCQYSVGQDRLTQAPLASAVSPCAPLTVMRTASKDAAVARAPAAVAAAAAAPRSAIACCRARHAEASAGGSLCWWQGARGCPASAARACWQGVHSGAVAGGQAAHAAARPSAARAICCAASASCAAAALAAPTAGCAQGLQGAGSGRGRASLAALVTVLPDPCALPPCNPGAPPGALGVVPWLLSDLSPATCSSCPRASDQSGSCKTQNF